MKKIQEFSEYNLRNLGKMNHVNDGTRSLFESILPVEVIDALHDWIENNDTKCVLIGGLALSYYIKPRYTSDVDVLFLSKNDIPNEVYKFKHHRPSAYQHNKTHVEVEAVTPELINTTIDTIQAVFDTAKDVDGIKVASPSALIALKLGRFSRQDQADIEGLTQFVGYNNVDLEPFKLSQELLNKYIEFK